MGLGIQHPPSHGQEKTEGFQFPIFEFDKLHTFWEENLCWSIKGAFSLRKFFNLGNKANHELWWIGKKFEKLVHWELVPLLINWSKAFSQIRLLHLLKRSSFTLILFNYQDLSRFPSFYILSFWTRKSYVRINQNEVICDMAVCCTLLGCKWGELWPNPISQFNQESLALFVGIPRSYKQIYICL